MSKFLYLSYLNQRKLCIIKDLFNLNKDEIAIISRHLIEKIPLRVCTVLEFLYQYFTELNNKTKIHEIILFYSNPSDFIACLENNLDCVGTLMPSQNIKQNDERSEFRCYQCDIFMGIILPPQLNYKDFTFKLVHGGIYSVKLFPNVVLVGETEMLIFPNVGPVISVGTYGMPRICVSPPISKVKMCGLHLSTKYRRLIALHAHKSYFRNYKYCSGCMWNWIKDNVKNL